MPQLRRNWPLCTTSKVSGNGKSADRGRMRRVNLILFDRSTNQSEDSTEEEVANMVLQVGGNGLPPDEMYYLHIVS